MQETERTRREMIAVKSLNRVLVALLAKVLLASSAGGVEITEIIRAGLLGPSAVAVDGAGNVYIAGYLSSNVFQVRPDGTITEIIDAGGDGAGNILNRPTALTVDAAGNVYVAGGGSSNVFRVTPDGVITEIIDAFGAPGPGPGGDLLFPTALAVDAAGNVYVAGQASGNVLRVTGGLATEIIDSFGDGMGNVLGSPSALAVDAAGNVYVAGRGSHNVFRVMAPGGPNPIPIEIIDASGDGAGNILNRPEALAVDAAGNVYVAGGTSDNVFQVTPGGVITEIVAAGGDDAGNILDWPTALAVDAAGNVYVAGEVSDNVFRVTPGGAITEIIDVSGDGAGNPLDGASALAVDAAGNVYVAGEVSDNVFRVTPGGAITEIIDISGDGAGNPLHGPSALAVDAAGNVYVAGEVSDNVFQVTPGGAITEIIDISGDGAGNPLGSPAALAVDAAGNVYVVGEVSDNVFRVTPGGAITEIIDADGDGAGNPLDDPRALAVDAADNVYVVGEVSDNVFRVTPGGAIAKMIDADGDGAGNPLDDPRALAVDAAGNVYVAGFLSDNVFRVTPGGAITEIIDAGGDGAGNPLDDPSALAVDTAGNVYVAGRNSHNVFQVTPGGAITEIIDISGGGGGAGHQLQVPEALAVDAAGNVYVAGRVYDNVFQVTPGGTITEIIDASGDGTGNPLHAPSALAVDAAGNIYVTGYVPGGGSPNNVFRIRPDAQLVVSSEGDLAGASMDAPVDIVLDTDGSLYVVAFSSVNALKRAPDGTISEVIDSTGTGTGQTLQEPRGIAVAPTGNVYVAGGGTGLDILNSKLFEITPAGAKRVILGYGNPLGGGPHYGTPQDVAVDSAGNIFAAAFTNNVFKVTPADVATEIIDSSGDGSNSLSEAFKLAVDASGNVFVNGRVSDNVFKISPGGIVTEVIDASGDGENPLDRPYAIAVGASGNLYVCGQLSDNVFEITPAGVITKIMDATGDGAGNVLDGPSVIAISAAGHIYVSSLNNDLVFRIEAGSRTITRVSGPGGDGFGNTLDGPTALAVDASEAVYVTGGLSDNILRVFACPAGTPCDDGLHCNGTDTCGDDGRCSVHTGSPCPGPDGDSDCAETCDEQTDTCTAPDFEGTACDDGAFCNGADTCTLGACSDHDGNPCPGPDGDGDCAESCDETSDTCTLNDTDGSACDDGTFCNGADTCGGGSCTVHAGDPCVLECNDACNELAMSCLTPAGAGCSNDGDVCTFDQCDGLGMCVHTDNGLCEIVNDSFPPDGTATTDPEGDGATAGDPIETSVTTPSGGSVSIGEQPVGGSSTTFFIYGYDVEIDAPAESVNDPLRIVFELDESILLPKPFTQAHIDVGFPFVIRETGIVANCAAAGVADPDPCVESRFLQPDGDVEITVLFANTAAAALGGFAPRGAAASTASLWTFGIPAAPCPVTVDAGCAGGFQKGVLLAKEKAPGDAKLVAKLIKGPQLAQTDLGNPLYAADGGTGTTLSLCLYDGGDDLAAELAIDRPASECAGGNSCWKPIGTAPNDPNGPGKGYTYRDGDGDADGVQKLLYKGGDTGKSKVIVKAKGAKVPAGIPASLQGSTHVTMQLRSSDGVCLSVTLNEVKKQTAELFKAK